MSDLHARFAAFRAQAQAHAQGQGGDLGPAPAAGAAAHAAARPEDRLAQGGADPVPARPLPEGAWRWVSTACGAVPVRDDYRPLTFGRELRGPWPSRAAGAELGPPEGWRWLDLETTGLSGGRAFLAGVAGLEGEGLAVRQYLLEDVDREPALLSAVAADLAGCSALVTFNGKSFDLPLLRDRCRLCGRSDPAELPHWDLLHGARRLWGRFAGGASLGRLQEAVLGEPRGGDVPGECIPALYRAWLEGDDRALDGVCAHNREDLFALGGVAARLCAALADGARPGLPAAVLGGLARTYERLGDVEAAIEGHLACGEPAAALRAAALLRRSGRSEEAAGLWEAQRRAAVPSLQAAVELAKHLEHRRRDPAAALAVVREAMRVAQWSPGQRRAELEHRLRRLQRKTAAQEPGAVGAP